MSIFGKVFGKKQRPAPRELHVVPVQSKRGLWRWQAREGGPEGKAVVLPSVNTFTKRRDHCMTHARHYLTNVRFVFHDEPEEKEE